MFPYPLLLLFSERLNLVSTKSDKFHLVIQIVLKEPLKYKIFIIRLELFYRFNILKIEYPHRGIIFLSRWGVNEKKCSSSLLLTLFFVFSPLLFSFTCSNCTENYFILVIKIAAGEGTTNPAPGNYELDLDESEYSFTAIPAEGWRIQKVLFYYGKDSFEAHENKAYSQPFSDPSSATFYGKPTLLETEHYSEYEVYFEKIPDPSTTTTSTTTTTTTTTVVTGTAKLELLAVTKTDYDQNGLNAPSGGGDVTCYADSPYTFSTGTTIKLSCNPKSGYQFVRWDFYTKNVDGVFLKTGDSTEIEPTIIVNADTKAVAIFQ